MKKALALLLSVVLIISSVTCALVFPAAATTGENLWTSITAEDLKNFDESKYAVFRDFSNQTLEIGDPTSQAFYIKMPELETGAEYQLSFLYKTTLTDVAIEGMAVIREDQIATINDRQYNTFPNDVISVLGKTTASSSEKTAITPCVFDATDTQYYLAIRCGNKDNQAVWPSLKLYELSLTKVANAITVDGGTASVEGSTVTKAPAGSTVTLTATPPAGKVFEKWQVVSGGIELADKLSATTTFTMPETAVSVKAVYQDNLWTNIASTDFKNFGNGQAAFLDFADQRLRVTGAPIKTSTSRCRSWRPIPNIGLLSHAGPIAAALSI